MYASEKAKDSYSGNPIECTEHPHIVKVQGVASGEPIILGTRTMVRTIIEQYQLGNSIEEILWDFSHLTSAQCPITMITSRTWMCCYRNPPMNIGNPVSPSVTKTMLKLYLNENLTWRIAKALREYGYYVISSYEAEMDQTNDPTQF